MGERIAKAWRAKPEWSDDWDVVHAETASKARYRLKCDLSDCYPDLRFDQIVVRRAADRDQRLPAEHRVVADLSSVERAIIMHAFGADSGRRAQPGYRDHYCTAPGDTRLLRLAWEFGIFRGPYGRVDEYGDVQGWAGSFFYLTEFGRQIALSMLPTYR